MDTGDDFNGLFRFCWGFFYRDTKMPQYTTQSDYYHNRLIHLPFDVVKQAFMSYIDRSGRLGNFPTVDQVLNACDAIQHQQMRAEAQQRRAEDRSEDTLAGLPTHEIVPKVHLIIIRRLLAGTLTILEAIDYLRHDLPKRHPDHIALWQKTSNELADVLREQRQRPKPQKPPRFIRQPDPVPASEPIPEPVHDNGWSMRI